MRYGKYSSIAVVCTILMSLHPAPSNACSLGKQRWAEGCRTKCTAKWNGSCDKSCVWNSPAGEIIVDTKVVVNSESNGSYSVNLLSKDANIQIYEAAEAKLRSKIEAAGKSGNDSAKGKYEEQLHQVSKYKAQYLSNKNTLVVRVSAKGDGSVFDKKRGWVDVSYKAKLKCVGRP